MKVVVAKDYSSMSKEASRVIIDLLKEKKDAILGLATGSTPVGLYKELIKANKEGEITFCDVTTVNLDEYYPISPLDSQSYRYFMNSNLFDSIDIKKENTHVLNGEAKDPEKECKEYDEYIDSLGGPDIQVLGIGRNGHIAFNEPDVSLVAGTHKTGLTKSTIEANSRFFKSEEEVPKHALTMGIGSIFKAKKIIILASGADKKEAVSAMLSGSLTTSCPASLLALHPDVTLFCTEDCIK